MPFIPPMLTGRLTDAALLADSRYVAELKRHKLALSCRSEAITMRGPVIQAAGGGSRL
jgi:hypothetical protein